MNIEDAGNVLEDLMNDFQTFSLPNVRPIHNLHELREVYKLTHTCYVSTGHFKSHPSQLIVHYPHFDHIPETDILVAVLNNVIVGSVSVTFDGPSGFTVEEEFMEQCKIIREEGKSMAVVWRLVADESVRSNRTVLMSLVDAALERVRRREISTALIAVNPKHERVYCRMLNTEVVARKLVTDSKTAPSVLLRGNPFEIAARSRSKHAASLVFNPVRMLLSTRF
jgi:hypothetical protein